MVRHRKIVCSACRRRKSKCDGAAPRCSTCTSANSACHYEKAPSIAYLRELQDRIHQLENQQQKYSQTTTLTATPPTALIPTVFGSEDGDSISVDALGDVSYHNSTSAIHEAPPSEEASRASSSTTNAGSAESSRALSLSGSTQIRQSLVANAATQKTLEALSLETTLPHADIPKELACVLLRLHWCWLHPMFLFVYRPAFTRELPLLYDEQQRSAYCSTTLLKVLYAHSCRFIRAPNALWDASRHGESFQQLAERLMTEAKVSLAMETLNTPSIPTIQALLQQSARDVACGRSSQAWLYSGMAFRMAIDLGVHVSTDKLQHYAKSLSPEDIEIRKRLFWSLYAWDKHISLYLGRMPNFYIGTENVPLDFFDDFTETDPWEPFYGPDQRAAQLPSYPPTPGHIVSCFVSLCKLCKILSRLMLELYSPQPTPGDSRSRIDSKTAAFVGLNEDIQAWWTTLPSFLRIPPAAIPSLSPPPHITSLNLMYHTTLILLHRPHVTRRQNFDSPAVQHSWKICRAATTAIYDLLKMHVDTFGFGHITYMNSYCTYTAATTAVYQLETSDYQDQATLPNRTVWAELKFLLDILQRSVPAMPALNRSIDIIRARIKKILDHQAISQLDLLFTVQNEPQRRSGQPRPASVVSSLASSTAGDGLPSGALLSTTEQLNVPSPPEPAPIDLRASKTTWEPWLPAFPGQDVFYGSESIFDVQEGMSPEARSALMGSNLDPHMQLDLTVPGDAFLHYPGFT